MTACSSLEGAAARVYPPRQTDGLVVEPLEALDGRIVKQRYWPVV